MADIVPVTNLADSVESLKRTVAIPGTFATLYPNTQNTDLTATLADAFGEAQLDGWFPTYALDSTAGTVAPDLSLPEARLVIIYGACQLVSAQLLNLKNRVSYQAGTAKYETEQSVRILSDLLATWTARKADLVERAQATSVGAAFAVADMYFAKATGTNDVAFLDTSYVFGFDDPLASGNGWW